MSKRIFDQRDINRASRLVQSMNLVLNADDSVIAPPEGQFGFVSTIETDKTLISNADFDFEYEIPFDDDSIPNESKITLYNLSKETIANFKKDNILTISAGYKTDTGMILKGKISEVSTKHKDLDKVTTVYVLDNVDYADSPIAELTFSENTAASRILRALLEKLNLPIEVFKIQRDHIYENTTTVKGSITDNIKTYADVCGVSVYVSKQRIFCRPIWDGDNIHFTVAPETGMIDSPEPFEESTTSEQYKDTVKGYNINMLLQHRMNTAAIVDVLSKDYSGTFRVCSGKHTFDGLSAETQIKCISDISTEIVENASSTSSTSSSGGSSVVDKAINWAVQIANDDSHKYSQSTRWGPHYDCSSFAISAYQQAGIDVKGAGASYTGNMKAAFLKRGFKDVTSSVNKATGAGTKKGDVLLNEVHHAALVREDGGAIVHASSPSNGICLRGWYNYPWNCVLRYTG